MKIDQIAAQLYTCRDFMKTPAEIRAGLEKLRDIGYEAVQISGLGEIEDSELVAICTDLGLTICATHESGAMIVEDPARIVARLDALNCSHVAYPYPHWMPTSAAEVSKLADQLNRAGQVLAEAGKVLSYHNHHIEFRKFGGRIMLDILYGESDPAFLQGEIDTYWVQFGGGSPVEWCRRLRGRLPLLHLKDYAISNDSKVMMTSVGAGNLNWPEICAEAEKSGCEWFIVEQDGDWNDPFEALAESFHYLKASIVS